MDPQTPTISGQASRWAAGRLDEAIAYEWIEQRDRMDRILAPFTDYILQRARLQAGNTVLDVGAGTGALTLAAWRRVAPGGQVTGIDVSTDMLNAAAERLAHVPDHRIELLTADAETHSFAATSLDAAVSRFGVGHFADTAAAFTNLARALRPGGRLAVTEWAAPSDNEWMTLSSDVARATQPGATPPEPAGGATHAPEFDSTGALRTAIRGAGLVLDRLEQVRPQLWIGTDVDDVLAWFTRLPDARVLDGWDRTRRTAFLAELRARLLERTRPSGVHLASSAWIITAHRPHQP